MIWDPSHSPQASQPPSARTGGGVTTWYIPSATTTKPAQTVASVRRSVKTGRKQVKLTSSQVHIARKLGVPLEEYAKQLIVKEA